jgi:hypothetical protein
MAMRLLRGIAVCAPWADQTRMRALLPMLLALVLVPAALAAEPRGQTIAGTVSANTGTSITVASGDRSVTCLVLGAKAQAAIARWGVGARAAMVCTRHGEKLLLSRLVRLGSKERSSTTDPAAASSTAPSQTRRDARGKVSALGAGAITVTRENGTSLTCSLAEGQTTSIAEGAPLGTAVLIVCAGDGDRPALLTLQRVDTTAPAPPVGTTTTPSTERWETRGIVSALSSDGVTITPDAGGDARRCRITPAADSTAAAATLSLGAHVGVVCRRDGGSYVLAGATPIR